MLTGYVRRVRLGCVGALDAPACMSLHSRAEQGDATLRHSSVFGSRCMIGDLATLAQT